MASDEVQLTTPKTTFIFPALDAPDTKFKAEGEYKVKVRLDQDEAEPILRTIKQIHQNNVQDVRKQKGKGKKVKEADMPYTEVEDDDGNLTGEVEFNFKLPAQVTRRKDGKVINLSPKVFDAKKNIMEPVPQIWNGSVGKVAFKVRPYEAPIGVGVSLRLQAVQVIEVQGPNGGNADSFGFDDEDGYEFSEEDAPAQGSGGDAESGEDHSGGDDGDSDPDF